MCQQSLSHTSPIIWCVTSVCGRHVELFSVGDFSFNGPLARCVKLRVAHASEMPGTFSHHRELAIPICITARAWHTYREAWHFAWKCINFETMAWSRPSDKTFSEPLKFSVRMSQSASMSLDLQICFCNSKQWTFEFHVVYEALAII